MPASHPADCRLHTKHLSKCSRRRPTSATARVAFDYGRAAIVFSLRCVNQWPRQLTPRSSSVGRLPILFVDGANDKESAISHVTRAATRDWRQRLHELAQVLELEKDQLRGVPIPTLLARAARLYARNGAAAREAPAETFALSHAVGRLDFFISHAWRSPRLAKYLALCRYFNGHLAVHAALLGCFLTFFWALHRAPIPGELMVQFPNRIDKGGVLTFPMAAFNWHHVSFFAYLATAALAHQLLRRRQTAFLDIACVNQLDDTSKALGIQRLGAVLQRTERMLVLADEHYWKRLWCVFEVAAFCRHANASRLVILPLHSPMIELGMGVFFHLALSVVFFKGLVITGSMDPNSAAFQTYVRNWLIGAAFLVQPFIILTHPEWAALAPRAAGAARLLDRGRAVLLGRGPRGARRSHLQLVHGLPSWRGRP